MLIVNESNVMDGSACGLKILHHSFPETKKIELYGACDGLTVAEYFQPASQEDVRVDRNSFQAASIAIHKYSTCRSTLFVICKCRNTLQQLLFRLVLQDTLLSSR